MQAWCKSLLPLELKMHLQDHLDGDESFPHPGSKKDDRIAHQGLIEQVHLKPSKKGQQTVGLARPESKL